MGKVVLYSTKRRISLTLEGLAAPNWNYAMYSPDFRAYKGAQTDIEFVVRDVDRKPIDLTDMELIAVLVDFHNNQTHGVVELQPLNPTRGLVRMTITPRMMRDFPMGFMSYTVQIMTPTGPRHLYVDKFDEARGFFEVREGAYPEAIPSVELDPNVFTSVNVDNESFRVSTSVPGNLQAVHGSRLHTVAVYTDKFHGKFWIEGSLESDTAPANEDWFPVEEFTFTGQSGIEAFNIDTNLYWVRFRFQPVGINPGSITKVLFRN